MLIGCSNVDETEMVKHITSAQDFKKYAESLVPDKYRHCRSIVDNQIYYNALILRKMESVHWNVKKGIILEVMCGLKVVGYMDIVLDAGMLDAFINEQNIVKYWKMEGMR